MIEYRRLVDGSRRDPLAWVLRGTLGLAEIPYRIVVAVRNWRYDTRRLKIHHAGVPVISIGNLTAGGTGKTPLVRYVARVLRERGVRVAIVSRGYGAPDGEENDEALELAATLPDVPHVQDPDRVEAARIAVEELETEVVLMDDGFQHRRLGRDLDVIAIDATRPFGYDHLLPRGLLREPVSSLARAGVAVLTRCDCVTPSERDQIRQRVLQINGDLTWVESVHAPSNLLRWPQSQLDVGMLHDKRVAVLCGIGNPDAFIRTTQGCGATVVATRALPDHAHYDSQTMQDIVAWLRPLASQVEFVVCTHKDLVKIQTDRIAGLPLMAIVVELRITSGESALKQAIASVTGQLPITGDSPIAGDSPRPTPEPH